MKYPYGQEMVSSAKVPPRPAEPPAPPPPAGGRPEPTPVQQCGGLVVRAGDTLIVSYRDVISLADADRYKALIRERLPELADVLVLSNVDGLAVYRPAVDQ